MKCRALCLVLLFPLPAFAQTPAPAALADEPPSHLRLAFTSTSAFGVTNAGFFNEVVGARFDYRFTQRFAFGGALGYANLKGKDGRAHNVLPEAALEYRVPISGESFGLPLRFMLGFLPKNGPTLRVGVGLDFALSDSVSLEVVPLEPMAWVNRERTEVSLNAALGLRLAL